MEALGSFIRTQRKLADLSLRELAEMTEVSNPYLSQLERGLHQPSVRVLKSIANALNVSAETLLVQAGLLEDGVEGDPAAGSSVEVAIRTDPVLSRIRDVRPGLLVSVRMLACVSTPVRRLSAKLTR